MSYDRRFPAPPQRVFSTMLHCLLTQGRVHGIEGMGSVVVFSTRRPPHVTPRLVAQVIADGAGARVEVVHADRSDVRPDHEPVEARRLAELLDRVDERLQLHERHLL